MKKSVIIPIRFHRFGSYVVPTCSSQPAFSTSASFSPHPFLPATSPSHSSDFPVFFSRFGLLPFFPMPCQLDRPALSPFSLSSLFSRYHFDYYRRSMSFTLHPSASSRLYLSCWLLNDLAVVLVQQPHDTPLFVCASSEYQLVICTVR